MARKISRRYRRRRGRWSVNIKNIEQSHSLQPGINGNSIDLCLNPIQSDITVSQQYTVKNIELSVFSEQIDNNLAGDIEGIEHYIMYVPQGMNLTTEYNLEHPEYIMAYYYQGNPVDDKTPTGYRLKIKSRMARRLQTGDRIIYFYKCRNTYTQQISLNTRGLVRWWTKAN